jgi:site-specific recombinase XerD
VSRFEPRNSWRIQYTLRLRGRSVRKSKYTSTRADAQLLARQIGNLENATKTRIAIMADIEGWIERGWITAPEAALAFPGFAESARRAKTGRSVQVDFAAVRRAYEEYALRRSKAGNPFRHSHKAHMHLARQVIAWLQAEYPTLALGPRDVDQWLDDLRRQGYSPWSIYHYLTKARLLLDQAQVLGMIEVNPARQITVPLPKVAQSRRILAAEEIEQLLQVSLEYRDWISGGLPTVVRLGLYAGLRDEEMCWLRWDAIDWKHRILSIQATVCEETGEQWVPKDFERRRLDVKPVLVEYLEGERSRQEQGKIAGPFVLLGGGKRHVDRRNRPLGPSAVSHAFGRMIRAAGMDPAITVYSMRHTYATTLLRPPPRGAGLDIRTVQQRLGHSEVKTTMEYLHHIEPEEHPTDGLPY